MKTYARAAVTAVGIALLVGAQVEIGGAQAKHLVLEVARVEAIDECGGNWLTEKGSDEISIGGLAIDPTGRVRKLRTVDAGTYARDGSTRNFNPPRKLAEFSVRGTTFPQLFQAVLVLVERDPGGGFNKYLDKLVKQTQAIGTAAVHEPSYPTLLKARMTEPPPVQVGEVLTAIAAEKIGKQVKKMAEDEIRERWNSDIFTPVLKTMNVRSASFVPPNNPVTLSYKEKSCNYRVTARWRMAS